MPRRSGCGSNSLCAAGSSIRRVPDQSQRPVRLSFPTLICRFFSPRSSFPSAITVIIVWRYLSRPTPCLNCSSCGHLNTYAPQTACFRHATHRDALHLSQVQMGGHGGRSGGNAYPTRRPKRTLQNMIHKPGEGMRKARLEFAASNHLPPNRPVEDPIKKVLPQ